MQNIIGIWRLAETRAVDDSGEAMHPPYGPKPMGLIEFTTDGRMIAVLCDARNALPSEECEREYNSYCGNYTFDGTTLITRVDCACDPERVGGDQVRCARFEGDRLVLRPPAKPWKGLMQHRELFWEKVL